MKNVICLELNHFSDRRGSLIPLEYPKSLPFDIKRIYYIYNVDKKEERGFHSHRNLEQILICLGGNAKIRVSDGKTKEVISLDSPNKGLYIGPMIWREMFDFSPNATLLVLASKEYDEKDYIKDYLEYKQEAIEYFNRINSINNYTKGRTINLKLVEETDAEFLFKLRINKKLNKYLSKIDSSVEDQIRWIKYYKIREFNREEFYFKVFNNKNKEDIGFVRLYNIDYNKNELTFGSFIMGETKTKYAALEAMVLMMEISFKYLKMNKVLLDVRKDNEHAKKFYKRFGFTKVRENDLDEFYELKKEEYQKLFIQKYQEYIGGNNSNGN